MNNWPWGEFPQPHSRSVSTGPGASMSSNLRLGSQMNQG
jgi:hypothetical protein